MKKFRFLLTASSLIVVLSLFACNKEDCQLAIKHKAELRIFNQDSVNVTSKYEIGFNNFVNSCVYPPGISPNASIEHSFLDSLVKFSLTYCCDMESIKYKIRLNEWPNDEFIDSFYIQVEDENKCQNCNVLSAISLTDKGHISFDGSVIKIEVYE